MWKALLYDPLLGLSAYSHKTNAAFHHIVSTSESSSSAQADTQVAMRQVGFTESKKGFESFELQDFILKGMDALSALGLIDNDGTDSSKSMFAAMDCFRQFDRQSKGHVNIEEFVVGVIEKLRLKLRNRSLFKSISEEVAQATIELRSLLARANIPSPEEVKMISDAFPMYWNNFSCFHYLFANRFDPSSEVEFSRISNTVMHDLFGAIADAEDELIKYFHLPNKKLHSLLGDSPELISGLDNRASAGDSIVEIIQKQPDKKAVANSSKILWLPQYHRSQSESIDSITSVKSAPSKTNTEPSEDLANIPSMDDTHIFLLQTAHQAIKNFILSRGVNPREILSSLDSLAESASKQVEEFSPSKSKQHESLNFGLVSEEKDRWILVKLFEAQQENRRLQSRLELLDIVLSRESKMLSSDQNLASNKSDVSFDDILEEINELKILLVEKEKSGIATKLLSEKSSLLASTQELKRLVEDQITSSFSPTTNLTMSPNFDSIDDQFRGLVSFREQVKEERNEHMKTAVELQIMKDKVARLQRELSVLRTPSSPRHRSGSDSASPFESEEHRPITPKKASDITSDEDRTRLQETQSLLGETIADRDRLVRENRRLVNAVKNAEDRVRAVLQDQMLLSTQLQTAEDELEGSKTAIQQLMSQLDGERVQRQAEEDKAEIINELKRELVRATSEISSLKESTADVKKLKQDLSTAETVIDELESKLTEQAREVEKGAAAMEQFNRYRNELSDATKLNRELSFNVANLESRLKAMQQLQTKYKEATQDLNEYKLKVEKIPSLLAEIARLRGSSRASMKALTEQDKQIADWRKRLDAFERDNMRLRSDNRSMQDMELKLREANAEISRLTAVAGEVTALKTDAKNAEEERKNLEVNYRMMRKILAQGPGGIRSSIIGPSTGRQSFIQSAIPTNEGRGGHVKMTAEDYGDMEAELQSSATIAPQFQPFAEADDDEDDDGNDNINDDGPFMTELRSKLKRTPSLPGK